MSTLVASVIVWPVWLSIDCPACGEPTTGCTQEASTIEWTSDVFAVVRCPNATVQPCEHAHDVTELANHVFTRAAEQGVPIP